MNYAWLLVEPSETDECRMHNLLSYQKACDELKHQELNKYYSLQDLLGSSYRLSSPSSSTRHDIYNTAEKDINKHLQPACLTSYKLMYDGIKGLFCPIIAWFGLI